MGYPEFIELWKEKFQKSLDNSIWICNWTKSMLDRINMEYVGQYINNVSYIYIQKFKLGSNEKVTPFASQCSYSCLQIEWEIV